MPGGDRTGPIGMGSRTGRGLGYCVGYGRPGFMNPGFFGGFAHGFGGGSFHRGFGRGFGRFAGWIPEGYPGGIEEKDYLENEISSLKGHLKTLEDRLKSIKEEK